MNAPRLNLASRLASAVGLVFLGGLLAVLGPAPAAFAQDEDQQTPPGMNVVRSSGNEPDAEPPAEDDRAQADAPVEPFARVLVVDGSGTRIDRQSGGDEELRVNGPVYRGDKLTTDRGDRVELQLPDGSLVRLDIRTALEMYDIADPVERGGATLLGLSAGSIQVIVPDLRGGQAVRVDTPSASIYPDARAVFRIDIEGGDAVRVSVERGSVDVAGQDGTVTLNGGERTRVIAGSAPRSPWAYNVMVRDPFDGWAASRDQSEHAKAAPGREYNDLPEPVRPYYSELSRYGRWVYTDEYGWTWKPDDVDSDWRPYTMGAWDYGPYGPVWVGSEPWGWATYRYGRWGFRAGLGWVWIPGRVFAPAHVYWYYGPDYVGWAPLGFWDMPVYVGLGWSWGDPWFDGCPWTFVHYNDFYHHHVNQVFVRRASVLGPDLHRGIVGRRPIVVADRGLVRRVGGRPELSPDAFRRAQDLAGRGRHSFLPVRDAERLAPRVVPGAGRPGAGGPVVANPGGTTVVRRPFTDVEREVVRRNIDRRPVAGGPERRGVGPGPGGEPPRSGETRRPTGGTNAPGERGSGPTRERTPDRGNPAPSAPPTTAPAPDRGNSGGASRTRGRGVSYDERPRVTPRYEIIGERATRTPARDNAPDAGDRQEQVRPAPAFPRTPSEVRDPRTGPRDDGQRGNEVRRFFGRIATEDRGRDGGDNRSMPGPADYPRGFREREPRRVDTPSSAAEAPRREVSRERPAPSSPPPPPPRMESHSSSAPPPATRSGGGGGESRSGGGGSRSGGGGGGGSHSGGGGGGHASGTRHR